MACQPGGNGRLAQAQGRSCSYVRYAILRVPVAGCQPTVASAPLARVQLSRRAGGERTLPRRSRPSGPAGSEDARLVALRGKSLSLHDEPMTLSLRSPAFEPGTPIPARFDHERGDLSPALSWDGVPEGSAGLVLLVDYPDAPVQGSFVH